MVRVSEDFVVTKNVRDGKRIYFTYRVHRGFYDVKNNRKITIEEILSGKEQRRANDS